MDNTKRMKEIISYMDKDYLYEQYILEENFFKKLVLGANLLSQVFNMTGVKMVITPQELQKNPSEVIKKIEKLPDSEIKTKAMNVVKNVEKNVNKDSKQQSNNVLGQINYIKELGEKNGIYKKSIKYLLLDDKKDILYYVNGDSIVKEMKVITGKDEGDVISYPGDFDDWMDETGKKMLLPKIFLKGGKSELDVQLKAWRTEFFNTLEKKTTPSGFYRLEADPKYFHVLTGNINWGEEFIKSDPFTYGSVGIIRPVNIDTGLNQLWLIHGTQNPVRVQGFNYSDAGRNMSVGCVNTKPDDNKFLIDIVRANPNMSFISLPEDGNTLVDISNGMEYIYGEEPKNNFVDIKTNVPKKKNKPVSLKLVMYDIIAKLKKPTTSTVTDISYSGGDDDKQKVLNAYQIKTEARREVDKDFEIRYDYAKTTDDEFLKSLKTLAPRVKNIYVNKVKLFDKDLGNLLKGSKLSTLSEGVFSWLKDKFLGNKVEKQQQEIQQAEEKITIALNSFINKHIKSGEELTPNRRKALISKAEEIKDSIVDKLDKLVDTTLSKEAS